MRKSVLLLALIAVLMPLNIDGSAAADSMMGEPIRLMRHPDINNGTIVFSYQGDLWSVPENGGLARRITVHEGTEDYPKFSPDGMRIAFTGDYNERRNALFVMPAVGGVPEPLTYHSSSAQAVTWTRDGKSVIFSSARESFTRFFKQFFTVPADGGLPVEIGLGKASFGTFSDDGARMAYNRHPGRFWWWKRYKGSQNTDVWIHDFEKDTFKQITDYEGNDSWPMWTGEKIYFISDRNGDIANLWVHDLSTGTEKQLTSFGKHGITWPSISPDGSKIVFEREARIYLFDTGTEEAKEVVVYAPIDDRTNMVSWVSPLEFVRSFDISPSGKRIIFEARGELFSAPAKHGDVRNLTESSGSRDSSPAWSPDGKWIAYISDKSGDDEVYLIDQMGKDPERKLTSSGHFKKGLMWSPDSKYILFSNEDNALYLLDAGNGEETRIVRNEHSDITTYSWSPDSKWIAYDFSRRNRKRDIYFYDLKKKEHHQLTHHLADDTEPVFTPDGKYLLLISERYHGARKLCRLSLLPEEKEPFIYPDDEEIIDDDGTDAIEKDDGDDEKDKKDKKDKKKEKKKDVKVSIDFTGIEERIRPVPKTGGRMLNNVQAADKYYYYLVLSAQRVMMRVTYDLYAFDTEKFKTDKIASTISAYGLASGKEHIGIFDGSNFMIVKVGSKASAKKTDDDEDKSGKLEIKRNTTMMLDRRAEWGQIFNEGWRVIKYHFYDQNTHGVDWDYIRDYYGSLLPYVKSRSELNTMMTEMVGELNASHQGVSGGDGEQVERVPMGFMGARLYLDEDSGLPRFDRIFRGDKLSIRDRSPLDNEFVKINKDDYLLAIDGVEIKPFENFYKHLVGKTRNKVSIMTNDKPTLKGAIETKFQPIYQDITLQYNDWVYQNEEAVDRASEGRIGYMHLQDMSGSGWTEFREKFEQYRYKDAMIIDVRYNGGGSIDTRVIDYLERRPYHIQQSRGESPIERPTDVFAGEVVVLCNEYSYSDAEVFPSAVKERGLGTVIGVPTLGFVIAVVPHYLIDGGAIRKTFIGIWEASSMAQLESRGAIPDIIVPSPPEMEKAGRDVQLEKAIEFLKEKCCDPRSYDYKTKIEER
ncbi:MAG: PD40 domain-containing protein [Candidatus Krumholzibacteriota bacterium]|nr:PD40 domain-containing protein [Candidatus Krumholzibacteriota bacterium]